MDDKKPDPSTIAEEAVGERLESRRQDADAQADRPAAASAGPQATVADKTAESIGERVGDAYADAATEGARERSRAVVQQATQGRFRSSGAAKDMAALGGQATQQNIVTVVAAFALGYVAALLIQGRRH